MQLAQELKEGILESLEATGETGAGFAESTGSDLPIIVGRIISGALTLVGIIFVVLLIYAGFLWMTAAGNEEKVTKAKKLLTQAVIGLGITLAAYAITTFVVNALLTATTGG